jgi:hypothetical protein
VSWTFTGGATDTRGRGVALLPDGDAILASFASPGVSFVRRVASADESDWARTYLGSEVASEVAVDAEGTIYVVGGSGAALWIVALSPDGASTHWTSSWSSDDGSTLANDVAIGPDGAVLTVGAVAISEVDWDVPVQRWNPADCTLQQWVQYDLSDGSFETADGLAVGPSGRIVVCGRHHPDDPDATQSWVAELEPDDFSIRWQARYEARRRAAVTLDDEDFVYAAGTSQTETEDAWIAKLEP